MTRKNDPIAKRRTRRFLTDRGFLLLCILASVLSLALLAILLTAIGVQGARFISWDFITGLPSRKPEKAGIWPAMIGSIWVCAICAATAIPIGVGTAILLEEYKPRRTLSKKLHSFIQLNIANLAGVPSVVYGILGLTVFANMFGLMGSSLTPDYAIGIKYFDEVYDYSRHALRLPAEKDEEPVKLVDGMTMYEAETGQPVTIRLLDRRPAEPKLGDVRRRARVNRVEEKSWYYIQLPFGRGVLAGGLTLMLVVLPIIIIASQEALRAVPNSLRHGALALGATRWQMIWGTSLPAAIPGIMTGSILAMSRALGEAAPLLILAGIVYITFTPANLMDSFTAMPLQIFNWASRPQEDFHQVAASGIIVLMAILLLFNATAVIIRQKFNKQF
ncbi:MAG: ABC transporter permease subunit [Phycisphaeraceae bacterium]